MVVLAFLGSDEGKIREKGGKEGQKETSSPIFPSLAPTL